MAITRDDVVAAVEQFLPRTVNFSRSSDLGEYSQDDVFERIVQITLTALLVDKDALFFIVYLASQRLLKDVDAALEVLDALDSIDELKGVSPNPPTRIDTAGLTDAQNALLGMSGSLVTEQFGITQYDVFAQSIDTFLIDEIVPNVKDGGNNAKTSAAIRASLATLASTWANILARREQLFKITTEYEAFDLRVKVASTIISAIRQKLTELQVSLPDTSTPDQGTQSEQILLDLSAAKSSLKIVAQAESPFGTVIAGPHSDGFTKAEYLVVEGIATVDPIRPILRGNDGKLYFDTVYLATTGQTIFDGDDYTPTWSDPGVPDFTVVAAVDQYLTIVDRGERFQISAVLVAALTLNGQTAHLAATPQRYVITESPPGTYFRSLASTFWDEFSPGATGSTEVASGTNGAWVRSDKVSGTDGTNIKAEGVSGTLRPQKAVGTSGTQILTNDDFTDPGATFLTDGVVALADYLYVTGANAGGNPYSIASINSETLLKRVGTWGANATTTWYIEDQYASVHFLADVDLFSKGVVDTDSVEITSGTQQGTYPIDFFVSAFTVSLLTVFTYETPVTWEVRYPDTVFVSETGNFLSNNVQPGDVVDITSVGTFIVATVDSQSQITLTTPVGSYYSGKTYAIYTSATSTTKFTQTDGADFVALGVNSYINGVQGILTVGGIDYNIAQRDPNNPTTTLLATTSATVNAGPLTWSVRAGDETSTFTDTVNSPFSVDSEGSVLVYKPGTVDERRVTIQTFISPSEVVLGGTLPRSQTGVTYAIISTYKSGLQIIVSGRRHDILSVLDQNTLEVSPPMALTVGQNIEFVIVNKGSSPLSYRLIDATGALSFGPAGFPSTIIGTDFDLMVGQQLKGRVTAIADINGDSVYEAFDVSVRTKIGQRKVNYRLRSLISNTTEVLRTPSADVLTATAGDVLTVWSQERPYILESASFAIDYILTVDGLLPARLASQDFLIVRGGSSYHGRYILLDTKNAALTLDADTADLRVSCAEVLLDFGGNTFGITTGTSADLSFDDDGDGYTEVVTDLAATFITDGVLYGHRIDVTYPDTSVKRAYVTEVVSETVIKVDPPLKLPDPLTLLSWSIVRSSVSNALSDSAVLRGQLDELKAILEKYFIPQNTTILNMLTLLKKQRMDRAIDLIYDGNFTAFVDMSTTDSSYASRARSDIQVVGGSTTASRSVSGSGTSGQTTTVAGIDPATGKSSPTQARASATQSTPIGGEEVETRVALAKAVNELVADERIRSMLQFSLDEARNQGIYELNGEIQSGVISDEDPTLPWIAKTGSVKDKVEAKIQAAIDALQYMIDNPDLFDDVTGSL